MKIQKGKLSTSNAVVIGVLVIVLYFVIPTGSQKKQQNSESAPEESTQAQPQAEPAPADATVQNKVSDSTSDTNPAVTTETPSEVNLRTIEEIDEERLAALLSRNPFWTTAIAKDTRTLPEETPASTIEVPHDRHDTLQAREQVRSSRISLIYSSSTGKKAAVLNDEIVYPGSQVSGNYRVLTVHPYGLGLRTETAPTTSSP